MFIVEVRLFIGCSELMQEKEFWRHLGLLLGWVRAPNFPSFRARLVKTGECEIIEGHSNLVPVTKYALINSYFISLFAFSQRWTVKTEERFFLFLFCYLDLSKIFSFHGILGSYSCLSYQIETNQTKAAEERWCWGLYSASTTAWLHDLEQVI